jgi:hypothetical protein
VLLLSARLPLIFFSVCCYIVATKHEHYEQLQRICLRRPDGHHRHTCRRLCTRHESLAAEADDSHNQFFPTLTNAIVIGLQTATVGGKLIPIRRHTGKAKDAESDSVAGRLNTVTASCEVERSNGKTSVSFKLYNLMGIQLITA